MCGCNGSTSTWTATPSNPAVPPRDFPDDVSANLYVSTNGGGTVVKK